MDMRLEKTHDDSGDIPLLDFEELHTILKNNLGLRLTNRSTDLRDGGLGDATPLTPLAGAADIIQFITLSACVLNTPSTLPHFKTQLETLYNKYSDYKVTSDPQRRCIQYIPTLMMTYARLLNIGDITHLPTRDEEARLPLQEETLLRRVYEHMKFSLYLPFVFDKTSAYYGDVPVLRLLLTTHFNQQLQNRLTYNCSFFNAPSMHYVLLSSQYERFRSAYDVQHYAMGKAGKHQFAATDVCAHFTFSVAEFSSIAVIKWLKTSLNHLKLMPYAQATEISEVCTHNLKDIAVDPIKQVSYFQKGVTFCYDNKNSIIALIGIGLFAALQATKHIQQEDESYTP